MSPATLPQWPGRTARLAGTLTFLVGTLALVGWALDVPTFKRVLPQSPEMAPLTALAFCLSGLALWCLAIARAGCAGGGTARPPSVWLWVGRGLAVLVAFIGLLRLGYYLAGSNLGLDQFWFREATGPAGAAFPSRTSPATALDFLFLGGALLLAGQARWFRV